MTENEFVGLIATVTTRIAGMPVDANLAQFLNREFPAAGPLYQEIAAACSAAVAEGWMCNREAGDIKFGRVAKPGPALHGFSVDVVEMADVVGPQHRHPKAEIDMVMPLAGDPKFDGHGSGWCVYGPDSVHRPTVAGGRAYVLYLLPEGAIEFTRG